MSDGISASLLELRVGQIGRKDEDFEVKKPSLAKRTEWILWDSYVALRRSLFPSVVVYYLEGSYTNGSVNKVRIVAFFRHCNVCFR